MGTITTAGQGSQPTFATTRAGQDGGAVRVGIMRVGEPAGIPMAQLMVRTGDGNRVVTLRIDDTVALPGAGILRLAAVRAAGPGSVRGEVDLEFTPHA